MYIVWQTLLDKTIREFKDNEEAKAYCKFLNLLCYSKPDGAGKDNCFDVTETAF